MQAFCRWFPKTVPSDSLVPAPWPWGWGGGVWGALQSDFQDTHTTSSLQLLGWPTSSFNAPLSGGFLPNSEGPFFSQPFCGHNSHTPPLLEENVLVLNLPNPPSSFEPPWSWMLLASDTCINWVTESLSDWSQAKKRLSSQLRTRIQGSWFQCSCLDVKPLEEFLLLVEVTSQAFQSTSLSLSPIHCHSLSSHSWGSSHLFSLPGKLFPQVSVQLSPSLLHTIHEGASLITLLFLNLFISWFCFIFLFSTYHCLVNYIYYLLVFP